MNRLSEETIRALSFMRTLKYVTDKELIAKYIAAEEKREEWFTSESWPFTADVKPDELPLLTYGTVARCYGKTVYPSETDDAFFEFITLEKSHNAVRYVLRVKVCAGPPPVCSYRK